MNQDLLNGPTAFEALHNAHAGEACFIVGNGPSLARLNLRALEGRAFFGVNRGYLAYQQGLPTIPYYMFADPLGYSTWSTEVRAAQVGLRFYRSDVCATPEYANAPDREAAIELPFHQTPGMEHGHFATHLSQGLYRGYTVATNCVQIAFHMGFSEVYLIGCDFSYSGPATHFYESGSYEIRRRNDMPIPLVFESFVTCRKVFEEAGRRLVNATDGGALEVLPRERFDDVIARLGTPSFRTVALPEAA